MYPPFDWDDRTRHIGSFVGDEECDDLSDLVWIRHASQWSASLDTTGVEPNITVAFLARF